MNGTQPRAENWRKPSYNPIVTSSAVKLPMPRICSEESVVAEEGKLEPISRHSPHDKAAGHVVRGLAMASRVMRISFAR
jgi:hypothetical protein